MIAPVVVLGAMGAVHSTHRDNSPTHGMQRIKETRSATMNIFRNFYFVFKSFVKEEFSCVFTINLFTIAENCTEK